MMKSRIERFLIAALICAGCVWLHPAMAQTPEPQQSASQSPANAQDQNKSIVFPVPTDAQGAALLQYENITFQADTSPMPDVTPTVRSARKNKDASSMFITHMMYRDGVGDIAYYNDGRKQAEKLPAKALHREMIRWRDEAIEANYELAILAKSPSVQYEISPLFSNDEEFKKGLNWLKKAAAHGYGNAEYVLGLVYFNGVGTKRDKKKGFEHLVRAAAHGVVNAYYAVGMIYEMGLNGKIDTEKSLYWLEKAAHFGSKDAIFILAMKYADGIDVPKDTAKAAELEKLDTKYHAWTLLHASAYGSFSHRYCTENYDESDIGSTDFVGGCESRVDYNDRFGSHTDYDDDESKTETIDDIAAFSLDYKIDYRLAALWLKKVATLEREQATMVRSQTHHITGCGGSLDGVDFGEIILSPEERSWDDYDNYPITYKQLVISIVDYHVKPSKLRKWLNDKAGSGDKDAILTLARLYDRTNYEIYVLNRDNGNDYDADYVSGGDFVDKELLVESDDEKSLSVELGIYKETPSKHEVKKNLQKAYEFYEKGEYHASAVRAAELLANDLKTINYDVKVTHPNATEWFSKAMIWSERGYQHYINKDNYSVASRFAEKAANITHKLGDDARAVEWYQHALDANEKLNSLDIKFRYRNTLRLARIYDSGTEQVQNKTRAAQLYKTILVHSLDSILLDTPKELFEVANRLGTISYEGAKDFPANKSLATEAYQRISELDVYLQSQEDNEIKLSKDAVKRAHKLIEELPKIDLQKEVIKQILAEKDKDPKSFFIFRQVLDRCNQDEDQVYCALEESNEEGEEWCEYYTCRIDEPYEESILKAITAITALSLASGSLNLEEIRNTFYYLAIYKSWNGLGIDLSESSSVYAHLIEFLDDVKDRHRDNSYRFSFNEYDEKRVYNIWYLRQIPYAAADKFKALKTDKTWNEYLNDAQKIVQQNAQLRTAFGYDPARSVQHFAVPQNSAK